MVASDPIAVIDADDRERTTGHKSINKQAREGPNDEDEYPQADNISTRTEIIRHDDLDGFLGDEWRLETTLFFFSEFEGTVLGVIHRLVIVINVC